MQSEQAEAHLFYLCVCVCVCVCVYVCVFIGLFVWFFVCFCCCNGSIVCDVTRAITILFFFCSLFAVVIDDDG